MCWRCRCTRSATSSSSHNHKRLTDRAAFPRHRPPPLHHMPSSKSTYDLPPSSPPRTVKEDQIEYGFIGKLQSLKYEYRADIRDRAALERNFREKFEALNRVHLSDGEFARQ